MCFSFKKMTLRLVSGCYTVIRSSSKNLVQEKWFFKLRFFSGSRKVVDHTANPFPVMTTGISLCSNSTL